MRFSAARSESAGRALKLGAVALFGVAGGAWILSLPAVPGVAGAPSIDKAEAHATLDALKPPKRERPLIAIIGINDATEATDYLMPYGILRRSNVADVVLVGTGPGPVKLYPALTVEPQATVADFDPQHPGGADYVIVPAMSRDDDPAVLEWLETQATRGATVIGVRRRQGGWRGRAAGRQTSHHPLVLSRRAAREESDDPLCRGPADRG